LRLATTFVVSRGLTFGHLFAQAVQGVFGHDISTQLVKAAGFTHDVGRELVQLKVPTFVRGLFRREPQTMTP